MASSCACEPQSGQDSRRAASWRVRPMRLEDIEKCLAIWRQVELTEAQQTVASALVTDPQGFNVAELEADGQVIGMCSGVMTRADTAFMGFYAVEPNYQGIGVGRELWAKTVERLGANTNIGLYGVPMMSTKYKKSGFKLEDSVRMLIYESQPGQALALAELQDFSGLAATNKRESGQLKLERIGAEQDDPSLLDRLIEYDAMVNTFERAELLRNYLVASKARDVGIPLTLALTRRAQSSAEPSAGDANIADLIRDSLSIHSGGQAHSGEASAEVLGYGCIRADNTGGAMIGPIYANSSQICEAILGGLLERFPLKSGGKYSVMALTSNLEASAILHRLGLRQMDQCSRMFTHFVPRAQADKIFYIHSPNFTLF